ncbi:MAG TPA: 4-(cytidine 5'-diphospho)-2-C-methyl-D-erythritol kinase [Crenotrichaceae bacterium]|nr:4-(cytidine 5'-diphospho)-2-C-methyl-D-erythritol kinase [Crenotrichaceae bacterium]
MTISAWNHRWPAPAKLNLMLRIVGRRADGYHLLQTVFQILDYCDYLQFFPRNDGEIVLEDSLPGVSDDENLVVRAAQLLRNKADELGVKTSGITILMSKNLPMGGGLGGGSSDAATTLVALNFLWGLCLPESDLVTIGLQLGADVPVFVCGASTWAEGVGEQLKVIDLPDYWYVVLIPDCHVSTQEVFKHPALTRDSDSITIDKFSPEVPYNDCLLVVTDCYPQVKEALSALAAYSVCGLTGTGGCVYASFYSEAEARAAAQNLRQNWNLFVARAVKCSPLHQMLAILK